MPRGTAKTHVNEDSTKVTPPPAELPEVDLAAVGFAEVTGEINRPLPPRAGLACKMNRVLAQVGGIPKDRENKAQGYWYRSEDIIMERLRALLSANGIAVATEVSEPTWLERIPTRNGSMSHVQVKVSVQFIDIDTGETIVSSAYGTGSDSGDKAIYKATTGGVKYVFNKTFMISDGDDAEGDTKTDAATQPSPAPPRLEVTPENITAVQELLKSVKKEVAGFDEEGFTKFLGGFGVQCLDDLTGTQLMTVRKTLEAKLRFARAKTSAQ